MTSVNLEKLVSAKQLKAEKPDRKEFDGLVRSGRARLADARIKALSFESRFDLAYNAAHALSLAALRRLGYRSENRFIVFQCLAHTLGLGPEHWRVLSLAHERRNAAEYSGLLEVDERLLADVLQVAQMVLEKLSELKPPP
jgi:hypothetical protein